MVSGNTFLTTENPFARGGGVKKFGGSIRPDFLGSVEKTP